MTIKDLKNNIVEVNALDIQAISTDTTTAGEIIDTQGFESITFVAQAGTLTDGTYTVKVEVGDNSALSDAADATTDELIGSLPALSASNAVGRVGVLTGKRYVRLSLVSTSTSTGGTLGAVAIKGHAALGATA